MKFIINFFFYGFLFYLISRFFPEAFHTLITWADQGFDFVKGLLHTVAEKAKS